MKKEVAHRSTSIREEEEHQVSSRQLDFFAFYSNCKLLAAWSVVF